ncbi:methionyl-tRNA formyltransferase [Hamadaea tsunoensis]|uniref:methionyl-tRNA formyltransferase n=1 Tax=Hamadaea tsunoensis TaxID=53368 RepID=UPI0005563121|nr:formyltransferase family protein [Hamadaea tsunoensis]
MSSEVRVLLVGLGPTTETALNSLLARCSVVGLLRPGDDTVVETARKLDIPVRAETSVAALKSFVDELAPDAVVVSSYDRILPAEVLEGRPFVNVHYAPLPRYRGRATVNWALINGEPSATISVHCLVPGLDAGGILFAQDVPIGPRDTVTELYDRLNAVQETALGDAVLRRIAGDTGVEQDENLATYACTRLPADGEIDWSGPTVAADRLVRALTAPFPGAYTYLGLEQLVVDRAEPRDDAPVFDGRIPGRVVGRSAAGGWVDVLTGDGVLRLHEVRLRGERHRAGDLIRSVKVTLGLRQADLLAKIAELEARLA